MKKIWFRMWLLFSLVTWVLYVGLRVLIDELRGRDIDLLEISILGFILSFFYSSFMMMTGGFSAFPRSKYLESNDNTKPSFKVTCSLIIDVPQGLDFNRLKSDITSKWVLTFSDDNAHVLKFRTKMNLFKWWGAAAWLKLDGDAGKIQLECFPVVYGQNAFVQKMQKEIEKCLTINT